MSGAHPRSLAIEKRRPGRLPGRVLPLVALVILLSACGEQTTPDGTSAQEPLIIVPSRISPDEQFGPFRVGEMDVRPETVDSTGQHARRGAPRVPSLPTAVEQECRRVVGRTERVGGEAEPVPTGDVEDDGRVGRVGLVRSDGGSHGRRAYGTATGRLPATVVRYMNRR